MPAKRIQQHPLTISISRLSRSRSNITGRYDSLKTVTQQLNRFEAKRACSSVINTALNDHYIVNLAWHRKNAKTRVNDAFVNHICDQTIKTVFTILELMHESLLYPHSDPTMEKDRLTWKKAGFRFRRRRIVRILSHKREVLFLYLCV